MFDRTKLVIDQTIRDVKKIGEIFNIVTQVSYIAYLIYALIAPTGNWIANTVLLVLSVAFFIFSLIAGDYLKKHGKPEQKSMRKVMYKVKRIYSHSKLLVKLFPLGISLYSVYLTSGNVNPFTLITLVFMLVSWILQIVTEILVYVFNKKKDLLIEAFKADVDTVLAPAKSVGNFFKKITGQETNTQPAPPPTKKMQKIEAKLQTIQEEKKREKLEKQAEKERKRQESFEEKKRRFRSVFKERELLRSAKKKSPALKEETSEDSDESDGQV